MSMGLGNTFKSDILKLVYNATAIAKIADNAATTPVTNIQVAFHTAWPGTGDQTASEAAYTSYARTAVARTTGGWTVTANSVSPVANIQAPQATGGSETLFYWSTGENGSGASKIYHIGVIGEKMGPFTADTADNITIPGHTFTASAPDNRVAFFPTNDSSLPGGVTEGTVYFVKTVSGAVITVSTTDGGPTLDITSIGDGVCYKVTPITVTTGVRPILSTSSTLKID